MFKQPIILILTAAAALAGPPLVCHPIEIGSAASLPWRNVQGWDGTDPKYNVGNLAADITKLLDAGAPLNLRMETLRRAAIYSARTEGLADRVTGLLLARAKQADATGTPQPNFWFDAGYYAESVRQTSFIYRYDMLTQAERKDWKLRGEKLATDGRPWIETAIRLGGKGMEPALAKVDEYRRTDLEHHRKLAAAK